MLMGGSGPTAKTGRGRVYLQQMLMGESAPIANADEAGGVHLKQMLSGESVPVANAGVGEFVHH